MKYYFFSFFKKLKIILTSMIIKYNNCQILMDNKSQMLRGYKSADQNIIELDIDLSSVTTNLNRNVIDKKFAKFRCNKAFVVDIYDKFSNQKLECVYSDYDKNFRYEKGQYVDVLEYEENENIICDKGIHFYLTKEAAYYHNLNKILKLNGTYKKWTDDGLLHEECIYVDGIKNGLEKRWHKNGQLCVKCNYLNDKKNGECIIWYNNGQIDQICNYINGKLEGLFEAWSYEGKILYREFYKDNFCIKAHF